MLEGAVKGPFGRIRKATGRQLTHLQMVADAFTADAFAGAGLIGAVAGFQVFFFATFHEFVLFEVLKDG
jgi:hypothetical protein